MPTNQTPADVIAEIAADLRSTARVFAEIAADLRSTARVFAQVEGLHEYSRMLTDRASRLEAVIAHPPQEQEQQHSSDCRWTSGVCNCGLGMPLPAAPRSREEDR